MKKKEIIVSVIMAFVMSFFMGLLFVFIARNSVDKQAFAAMPPAHIMYIKGIIESIIVGEIVVLLLPLGRLGRMLCEKANVKPPSFKFTALNSLPIAVISAILVSGICSFISIRSAHARIAADAAPPLMIMWFGNWIKSLPLSIIISYVLAIIISPFVVRVVGLGKRPEE